VDQGIQFFIFKRSNHSDDLFKIRGNQHSLKSLIYNPFQHQVDEFPDQGFMVG
jgi:hypothetical protein